MGAWRARMSCVVLLALAMVTMCAAAPAAAQPGSGMNTGGAIGTNATTGKTDIIGANGINMGFNSMAMLLQQQTFLLMSAALTDPKVQQAIAEQERRTKEQLRLYAQRGRDVIAHGQATTTFTMTPDPQRNERIASAFGPDAHTRGLVARNLPIYEALARQRQLRRTDVADVMAIAVAVSYQVARDLRTWDISPAALEDLRAATRRRLLEDPEFQGMPDGDRQTLHDFFGVWLTALVADYQQAMRITFTKSALQKVQQRAARAIQLLLSTDVARLRFTDRSFSIDRP